MNRGRVSSQVLLYFFMLMLLMITFGCSKSDDAPPATTYSISGTVTGASNVTVTLSGDSTGSVTVATSGGPYSFTGLANGTYTVTPSATGYSFDPISAAFTVNGSNMAQNFETTTIGGTPVTISGTVVVGSTPLSGVKVTLSGSRNASIITGTDGTWSFTGLSNTVSDDYIIKAYRSGYSSRFLMAGAAQESILRAMFLRQRQRTLRRPILREHGTHVCC
jgi:hypothetical protein